MSRFYTQSLIRSSKTKKEKQSGLLTTVEVLLSGGIQIQIVLSDLSIMHRKQLGAFLPLGFDI